MRRRRNTTRPGSCSPPLAPAITKANELLTVDGDGEASGLDLIPTSITPPSLRRWYASLPFAIGETPPCGIGHTTAELTLSVYARQRDRRDGEPERLKALGEGADPAEFRLSNGREAEMASDVVGEPTGSESRNP